MSCKVGQHRERKVSLAAKAPTEIHSVTENLCAILTEEGDFTSMGFIALLGPKCRKMFS
jgi:hypothetical protein